ncbi:MAG: hypothetical protein H6772_02385 [Pseudomonadales bacterium]|nr:hypothetical protein [Pseudomonadales bacterium]
MNQEFRNFHKRLKRQHLENKRYRSMGKEESGEAWSFAIGDYSKPVFSADFGTSTLMGVSESIYRTEETKESLLGIEKSLEQMILQLLEKKDGGGPIVVLDFGGGLGLSFCRIARILENEINEGKVKLIISNIEQNFDIHLAAESRLANVGLDMSPIIYALENNLVEYVEAELTGNDTKDVKSFRQLKIKTESGVIPLIGNVNLIHSRMSLVHSNIPEFHVPRIFELLSQNGIFIDSSFSSREPSPIGNESSLMNYETKPSFDIAYERALTDFHLNRILQVEIGPNKGKKLFSTILRKKDSDHPLVWA